jgi:ribosomal protein S18 acetylase RimI-like enzyme
MSDLRFRSATPAEYAEVADLTVAGFDEPPAPTAARLALLRDAAGRANAGDLLVAVNEPTGRLAGTASLLRSGSDYARFAESGEAELRLLAVHPEYRGRGIAFALMVEAIDRCRQWDGVRSLVLDTAPANVTAHRLYHRLGFVRVPERETRVIEGLGRLLVFAHDLHLG